MQDNFLKKQLIAALRGDPKEFFLYESNWELLVDTAESEGIAPLLYDFVRHNDFISKLPSKIYSRLAQNYWQTQSANLLLLETLKNILDMFEAVQIPVVVLKGAALIEQVYGDAGLRPMGDLDLLVRQTDADRAINMLINTGYQRIREHELRAGFDREFRAEVELISAKPFSTMVEIHWHLVGPIFASRCVDYDAVWSRSVFVRLANTAARILGPEDTLLHLSAHAIYKHRKLSVLNICDIDRVVRRFEYQLDWSKVFEIAEEFRWLSAIRIVLSGAANLLNTPVPIDIIERAQTYELPIYEYWLEKWWLTPKRAENLHVIPDLFFLPSFKLRARLIISYLFPGREYLKANYPNRSEWKIPLIHLFWLISQAVAFIRNIFGNFIIRLAR